MTPKQRAVVFAMFGGKCAYCGHDLPARGWHADHVKPIMRDGEWVRVHGKTYTHEYKQTGGCSRPDLKCAENLFPSCRACNINKSSAPLEVWRSCLARLPAALRRDSASFRHAERFGLLQESQAKIVFYFERCKYEAA